MKMYFINENDQQIGPFTLEEIKSKRIKKSTMVWYEGLEEWVEAFQVEELKSLVVSEPPPIKKKVDPSVFTSAQNESPTTFTSNKTEISGSINLFPKIKPPKTIFSYMSSSGKTLLILWISFHSIGLLLSSNGIKYFNTYKENHTDKFWPIVEFIHEDATEYWVSRDNGERFKSLNEAMNSLPGEPGHRTGNFEQKFDVKKTFKGIFTDYDFSEFIFYTLIYLVILILVLYNKKNREA